MVALGVVTVENIVDHMAEGGVADIVQQGRDLLFQVRTQAAHQQHDAHGVIEAGGRHCDAHQRADPVL